MKKAFKIFLGILIVGAIGAVWIIWTVDKSSRNEHAWNIVTSRGGFQK